METTIMGLYRDYRVFFWGGLGFRKLTVVLRCYCNNLKNHNYHLKIYISGALYHLGRINFVSAWEPTLAAHARPRLKAKVFSKTAAGCWLGGLKVWG